MMLELHPQILEKDGRKTFAVLSYEEFLELQETLRNYEDLRLLRQAKGLEKDAPTIGLGDLRKELGI